MLPAGFRLFLPPFAEQTDVWFPYGINDTSPYRGNPIAARLRPGVTIEQANARDADTWCRNLRASSRSLIPAAGYVSQPGGCMTR